MANELTITASALQEKGIGVHRTGQIGILDLKPGNALCYSERRPHHRPARNIVRLAKIDRQPRSTEMNAGKRR